MLHLPKCLSVRSASQGTFLRVTGTPTEVATILYWTSQAGLQVPCARVWPHREPQCLHCWRTLFPSRKTGDWFLLSNDCPCCLGPISLWRSSEENILPARTVEGRHAVGWTSDCFLPGNVIWSVRWCLNIAGSSTKCWVFHWIEWRGSLHSAPVSKMGGVNEKDRCARCLLWGSPLSHDVPKSGGPRVAAGISWKGAATLRLHGGSPSRCPRKRSCYLQHRTDSCRCTHRSSETVL